MLKTNLLAAMLLLFACGFATAEVILVGVQDPGTTFTTDDILGFEVGAHDMDDLRVEAFFADGTSSVASWESNGTVPGCGSTCPFGNAIGPNWLLTAATDQTWPGLQDPSEAWMLTNENTTSGIVRLTMNGAPGRTVFDIVDNGEGGDEGTTNSNRGGPFVQVSAPAGLDGSAIYRNEVVTVVDLEIHQGDLYEMLDITFDGDGLLFSQTFAFGADTDIASSEIVPEPSSGLLIGLGCLMATVVRPRRRASSRGRTGG